MVAKTDWHRCGTKLRHCHPMYICILAFFGQPREPALCQLYRHTFVPYWTRHFSDSRTSTFTWKPNTNETSAADSQDAEVGVTGVTVQDTTLPCDVSGTSDLRSSTRLPCTARATTTDVNYSPAVPPPLRHTHVLTLADM